MDVIDIKYRPMRMLFLRRFVKKVMPSTWNEAVASDILAISRYLLSEINDKQFISEFLKVPGKIIKRLSEFEVWKISQYVRLIERRDPLGRFIIPELKQEKITFKAPKALFKDVSFGDFVLFDSYYMDYADGKKSALDEFIISLYKPDTSQERAMEAAKELPMHCKYAIALNYEMTRKWLALRYTYLFATSEERKPEKKRKSNNWLPILDSLIAGDLANSDKYESLPMHTVLRYLNTKLKEGYKHGKV